MKEQLLKTLGADVLSSRKKLRKTIAGVESPLPPPPLVRPRVNSTTIMLSQSLIHYIINYKLGVLSDDIFETDSMNYRFFNKFVLYWHKNVDKWAANTALI